MVPVLRPVRVDEGFFLSNAAATVQYAIPVGAFVDESTIEWV
jgi:hypothetical protein